MSRDLNPVLSIVVPCGAAHAACLADCLSSLNQPEAPAYEIIVVNSHAEHAVAQTAAVFGAKLVDAEKSTAGAARNLGVRAANTELICFIDADCVAEPGWLLAAHTALAHNVLVGGPVLNCFPLHPIATIDNLMQFIDQAPGRPAGPAGAFPGCNMAMRKDRFLELEGFDEHVQTGEDTLLTNRSAKRWPGRVQFVPNMRVCHRGRTTMGAFTAHQFRFGQSRGRYGLHLTRRQQLLGRSRAWAIVAACKRLGYFAARTARWDPPSLLRLIVFSPILLIGLAAWARGFNAGCRIANESVGSIASSRE